MSGRVELRLQRHKHLKLNLLKLMLQQIQILQELMHVTLTMVLMMVRLIKQE